MPKLFVILALFLTFAFSSKFWTYAAEFESPRFKIELEELNIAPEKKNRIYTIQSKLGKKAFSEFKKTGYTILPQENTDILTFSLSPTLLKINNNPSQSSHIELSASTIANSNYLVKMVQEYAVKNLSGDILNLNFSLEEKNSFRKIPNQNKNQAATLIMTDHSKQPVKLYYQLENYKINSEGTYETIIDYITIPSY